MPISNNRSDKYAPERGNEPPAQGAALGEQGQHNRRYTQTGADAVMHRELVASKEMMPAASDKGSQPYSCPLGDCEMAGDGDTPILYLAFR